MITRAPFTPECCSGTASSHRFNWDSNSDSTKIQSAPKSRSEERYFDLNTMILREWLPWTPWWSEPELIALTAPLWSLRQRLKTALSLFLIYCPIFVTILLFCYALIPMMVSSNMPNIMNTKTIWNL